jgi:hypothetical protein
MHSPEQAKQEMVVVIPQTVIVQRWVPWWLLQSSHLWKTLHESDFAGRVATTVRRHAQASSKALVFFMVLYLLGIGASPWGPTKTVPQML